MSSITATVGQAMPAVRVTGRDGRGRESEFPTSDPAVFLSVFTFHHKGRSGPVYVTRMMGVRKFPAAEGSRFSSTLSAPMSAVTVNVDGNAARFSAKRASEAHAEGVRLAQQMVDSGDDQVARVLAETPAR